jgi:Putative peptidoglycan binding domain
MKLFPTVPLALVLAAGIAAAATAQTAPAASSEPKASVAKPQASSSAQMKAAEPKAERIAHLKAIHAKRAAQTAGGTAHLHHPAMQAERLTPDQVKAAQQQLQAVGLYNGPTDGMMDPDTRAALARYQQQSGLRRTETLDQQTLTRLNASQTSGVGSSAPGPSTTVAPSGSQGASAPPSAGGSIAGQPINK